MFKQRFIFSSIFVVLLILSFIVAFGSGIRQQAAPEPQAEEVQEETGVEGTFEGTAEGYGGPLKVEVIMENDTIQDVEVVDHSETDGISDPAIEEVPAAIVEQQNYDVDIASGATVTSEAIMEAVENVLN